MFDFHEITVKGCGKVGEHISIVKIVEHSSQGPNFGIFQKVNKTTEFLFPIFKMYFVQSSKNF